jgi:hypothetical protein
MTPSNMYLHKQPETKLDQKRASSKILPTSATTETTMNLAATQWICRRRRAKVTLLLWTFHWSLCGTSLDYYCTSIHWTTAAADRITALYMSIVIFRNLQLDARQMKGIE